MVENDIEKLDKKHDQSVLPINCLPLTHQVAGHFHGKGRTKLGFLQTNDGIVLKPVQSPPRGEREHSFYRRIFTSNESELNEDEIKLKNLLPKYRGTLIHNDIIYIKMDDLAHGITKPVIIDIKIGKITHDPEASPEKIARQKIKYPPVEKTGYQLMGMRVYNKADNSFSHYDKIFGRGLDENDLIHGMALFYQFHETPQMHAVKETIRKFEEIKNWFESQTTYHFYTSSLVVTYEANLADILKENLNSINNSNSNNSNLFEATRSVRVIMADFAHVFPSNNNRDENYLFGLNNLIENLKLLLKPNFEFKDVRFIKN